MAGIAIVLDLLRKNQSFTGQALHSHGMFSAKLATSAAAASASVVATYPFAFRASFGNSAPRIAFCDAGTGFSEDYISSLQSDQSIINFDQHDYSLKQSTKQYNIKLKPLFSAFMWMNLARTALKCFLFSYLPHLVSRANMEDEEDLLPEEDYRVNSVTLFKKSMKQIGCETAVETTRRILERLVAHYVSQRMVWKLTKDVPMSAACKAQRGMSSVIYFTSVTKTACRGHFLGILASWFVQVGIDIWQFFKSKQDDNDGRSARIQILRRKIFIASVRCGACLVFVSIGAGLGAMLFQPTTSQWIGCAIGEVSGSFIVPFFFGKVLHMVL
ncbi:putative fructose-bisphosphate aldolase, cytoplasmic isozyme 1 [Capsicum annuum]|uniref:uncharacterized protein LOC107844977 n=1 Tax=Capsicum annuum TaxID=4072 RepID=UPI001FB0A359|nr:uncharacterized protein LOC107844977 [Capsicum annuum]KAF3678413.1 putative fructose-bisphosphate aldolase, cytoplasmic isozyme 1 [Capsicum annuum]